MNAALLREEFIDRVGAVVAPVLVGGKGTPTLVDGTSLVPVEELSKLVALGLTGATRGVTHMFGSRIQGDVKALGKRHASGLSGSGRKSRMPTMQTPCSL